MLITKIYFWYSLFFLIGRNLSVLIFASLVNEAAKQPINILRPFASKSWNMEVQRFLETVRDEVGALSGHKFFYLTRTLILAVNIFDFFKLV